MDTQNPPPPTGSSSWSASWPPPSKNPPSPAVKVLITTQQKLLLVNAEDLIFASIDGGMITVVARRSRRQLQLSHPSKKWKRRWPLTFSGAPHRSHLVNIHHIKEVIPLVQVHLYAKDGRQEADASPSKPLANQTPPRTSSKCNLECGGLPPLSGSKQQLQCEAEHQQSVHTAAVRPL